MEGVSSAGGMLKGALDTQRDLAAKVLESGAQPSAVQADGGAAARVRAGAMQEQGVGRNVNVSV